MQSTFRLSYLLKLLSDNFALEVITDVDLEIKSTVSIWNTASSNAGFIYALFHDD